MVFRQKSMLCCVAHELSVSITLDVFNSPVFPKTFVPVRKWFSEQREDWEGQSHTPNGAKKAGFFQKVGAVQALMSKWEVAIALQMNWTWRLPLVFDWKLWKSPSFGGLSWIVFLRFLPEEGRQAGSKRNAEMRTWKSYTSPLCSGLSGRNLWVVLKEGLIWALCEI